MDSISRVAVGIEIGSQSDLTNQFIKMGRKVAKFVKSPRLILLSKYDRNKSTITLTFLNLLILFSYKIMILKNTILK